MKISRDARTRYSLNEFKFTERGNVEFEGDTHLVRLFVQKLNQKRDLINYPELAIRIGEFNGIALIYEINKFLLDEYKKETKNENLNIELFEHLKNKIGESKLNEAFNSLVEEFPPEQVYRKEVNVEEFLKEKVRGVEIKPSFIDEFISLWLGNNNPSYSQFIELFDDEVLEKRTAYRSIIDEITNFFDDKAKFGPNNLNLIEMLSEPSIKYPHSIREQLEYIHENWGDLVGKYLYRILIAIDIIREEELFRGLGPGKSEAYDYDALEFENFTLDKEWMPKVVMIAKNVYVWMTQLSNKYNRSISKLNEIPNEELEQLKEWGFTGLWLIGLWERSQASKTIKRWCGNPEAEASAYSTYDYEIAYDLGGFEAFKNLKDRAMARGLRLACDIVPNHTGIVSKWIMEHPDWYISLPYPPFPSYSYSGENLSGDSSIGIYLENKYFNRTDAAVTFKYVDFRSGQERFIYHGNDGTSFPWNDTAQLNFLIPEVRKAVIETILHVSSLFPIIRFDAAMTLTRKHYQRLWFPVPGTGGAIPSRAEHGISREEFYNLMPKEFWREVVDTINEKNPDTLLLAEAFWLLEGYFVRTLGMHRVYNSAFMNMLRDEDNAMYRLVLKNTLQFDPEILKRFVNFMNNPDEETAIKQFGDGGKYFGVCLMMVTMPGLPMFGHGQIEGFHEKYGMEYRRAYWDEKVNIGLLKHHEKIIFPILKKRYLFANVDNFLLYDFWSGNNVNEDVFAYSNRVNNERALIIYHNKYAETKGFIKTSVGFVIKQEDEKVQVQSSISEGLNLPKEGYCIFKDFLTGLEYIRRNRDLYENGLYLELQAFQCFVFMDFRIVDDNEFFHYAQLYDLLGGKGVYNLNETLHEIIYQPLLESFKNIVNFTNFRALLESQDTELILKGIMQKFNLFLQEVKKYSASDKNPTKIEEEIRSKLISSLQLYKNSKELQLSDKLSSYLVKLLPQSEFEWGILISWVFIHLLGKVVSETDFELKSRSWFDEWRLSKYIKNTLNELKITGDENKNDVGSIIQLMISHQNWSNSVNFLKKDFHAIFQAFFQDPETQMFLKVNRYQNILWFSAEEFARFTRWIWIIAVINSITYNKTNSSMELNELMVYYPTIQNVAKASGYQVNKFLEGLQNFP
ncbi:MAG: alpha-amylase [Candidatus Lokiarchaeota archaeon]|nr:alpha-amylase [Candidatus Lokiarchaeota archaeon]